MTKKQYKAIKLGHKLYKLNMFNVNEGFENEFALMQFCEEFDNSLKIMLDAFYYAKLINGFYFRFSTIKNPYKINEEYIGLSMNELIEKDYSFREIQNLLRFQEKIKNIFIKGEQDND